MNIKTMTTNNIRLTMAVLAVVLALGITAAPAMAGNKVVQIDIKGVIGQGVENYVKRAIRYAEKNKMRAVLITIDTPGGLLDSTKNICTAIQNTDVPVIVYVWPNGATATSAGFFILMCSDIAAMAPHTSTGSAHPVAAQGKMDKTMKEKVTNYSVEYMRALTERRGRNAEFAEKAIRRSKSITARNAKKENVIEIIAPDIRSLLSQTHGMSFKKADGKKKITLRTKSAEVITMRMSAKEKFIHTVGHPNIAYIFFIVGVYALIFEVTHPGTFISGAIGIVCLVIAFVAFSVLPVNALGILLIITGFVLFLMDLKIASSGLLSAGGVVALVIGSLFLLDGTATDPSVRVDLWLIFSTAATTALIIGIGIAFVIKSMRNKVTTGAQGMIGEKGKVKVAIAPEGKVLVHGELWTASAQGGASIKPGVKIQVVEIEGMELVVKPLD